MAKDKNASKAPDLYHPTDNPGTWTCLHQGCKAHLVNGESRCKGHPDAPRAYRGPALAPMPPAIEPSG